MGMAYKAPPNVHPEHQRFDDGKREAAVSAEQSWVAWPMRVLARDAGFQPLEHSLARHRIPTAASGREAFP